MALEELMLVEGPVLHYDAGFRRVLEDHMTYLRSHASTISMDVDAGVAYRFESDFYGLLNNFRVPAYLHWLTLRMNRLVNPTDFKAEARPILIPNETVVGRILQSHQTSRRVT